jgi:hypothetical protein
VKEKEVEKNLGGNFASLLLGRDIDLSYQVLYIFSQYGELIDRN